MGRSLRWLLACSVQRRMHRLALALLSVLLAAPIGAAEESPGQKLARSIEEEGDAKRRAALLRRVEGLDETERVALVRWARDRRERGGGWTALGPALVKIATPAAVDELGAAAASSTEAADAARKSLLQLPADVVLPQLMRGLVVPDARSRAFYQEALAERLIADPGRWLTALRRRQMTWSEEDKAEIDGVLPGLVAEAVRRAPLMKDRLVGSLRNADEAPIAAGLARGIRDAAAERRRAAAEADPETGAIAAEMDGDWLSVVVELLDRESPTAIIPACDALRVVVWHLGPEDPDGPWVRSLFRLLEHEDKQVAHAAWKALQGITGDERVQQSRQAWEAWWDLHRGGLNDQD